MNKNKITEPDYRNKPRHEVIIEAFNLLANPTRCNIVFLLLMYQSISLSKLSKIMKMAKTTISYHLNKCVKIGLVKEYEEPSNRTLKPKYYKLDFDHLKYISTDSIDLRNNHTPEGGLEFYWLLTLVKSLFHFYRNLLVQVEDYIENYINLIDLEDPKTIRSVIDEYTNGNQCFSEPFFFTKEALTDLKRIKEKFAEELNEIIKEDRKKRPDIPKEYLFYMHQIPLKKIIESKADISNSQKNGRKS